MSGRYSRLIYVGNLPANVKEWEIEDLFYKYGRILEIELKVPPRPPCYCFVEFEDSRDAEDAIRGRDGYNFDGCRLRVELANGGRRPSSTSDRRGGRGGGSSRRYSASLHSEFRVIVRGLPSSASWQDLKDHMRRAGDVSFAEVYREKDGAYGLVDYTNYEDMKYAIKITLQHYENGNPHLYNIAAHDSDHLVKVVEKSNRTDKVAWRENLYRDAQLIRKLDDTEFKNPWTQSYIRVKKFERSPSRSLSRSRSRSPRRNRSKSPARSVGRSVSKSRSRSPVKASRRRSRSRSKSGSPPQARSGSEPLVH